MMSNIVAPDQNQLVGQSFYLGAFKGTKLYLHWSFPAVLIFHLLRGFLSLYPQETMLYWGLFWGPMVFLTVLLVSASFVGFFT